MTASSLKPILAAIRTVTDANGVGQARALHEPWLRGDEWHVVKECLDSGWISTAGPFVERFERTIAQITGVSYVVATVNGTAALHLCLLLAGARPGDEVLTPSLSFVATANAITYTGATPHFVEVDETSLGVDPMALSRHLDKIARRTPNGPINRETGRPLRALVCMHTFGHPTDLDSLTALCEDWGLRLIEDAAEALGSLYKDRHVGNWGLSAALSFNGNKIVTTGGGGAFLTNDENLAQTARHLATTAKTPHPWAFIHDQVGYNYRLPSLNAALGCAQLLHLDELIHVKRTLADTYAEALRNLTGIRIFQEPEWARSNYWLNALILDESLGIYAVELVKALQEIGVGARPAWEPMHRLPMHANCPRMELETTERLSRTLVNLPSSAFLAREVDR